MTITIAGETELATIIQSYNEVTERLKHSHELLRREVCRLREEIQEKNRALERRERLAALGEMAAGVAHEIRNPLGGIGLYSSLLEQDLEDRPKQLDIAKRIGAAVCHMEGIVGDILAFAGGAEPHRRPTKLADILDSVLTQAAPRAQVSDVHIELDGVHREITLSCDGAQVERALLNLVYNALDAVGSRGRIWIYGDRPVPGRPLATITVADDGPGIDAASLERVFNPFFTTKDTGTGLGLAIVHRIAEAHGGRVTAGCREGGGAAFTLYLPTIAPAEVNEERG